MGGYEGRRKAELQVARKSPGGLILLGASLAALAVATGTWFWVSSEDPAAGASDAATADDVSAECRDAAKVAVPPAYLSIWEAVGSAQADAEGCTSVQFLGRANSYVLGNTSTYAAWIPEDTAWLAQIPAESRPEQPAILARSSVVLALPTASMEALGGARAALSPQVLGPLVRDERRLPGTDKQTLTVALPDPSASATGALGFVSIASVASGAPVTGIPEFIDPPLEDLTLIKAEHRMEVFDEEAEAVPGDRANAAVMSEALALRAITDGADLQVGHLPEATLQMPLIPLGETADEGVTAFTEFITSDRGRQALRAAGLRPADGGRPQSVPGLDTAAYTAPVVHATPEQAAQITQLFAYMHTRISSLVLMDASGSMLEPLEAGGASRISILRRAADATLAVASPQARTGLITFQSRNPDNAMRINRPVPLGHNGDPAERGSGTHADLMTRALKQTRISGGTPLYNAVRDGYRYATEQYSEGSLNQIVLLSDGENRDAAGSIGERKLLDFLRRTVDPERPIRIVAIGIGDSADIGALRRIAKVTGGTATQLSSMDSYRATVSAAIFGA